MKMVALRASSTGRDACATIRKPQTADHKRPGFLQSGRQTQVAPPQLGSEALLLLLALRFRDATFRAGAGLGRWRRKAWQLVGQCELIELALPVEGAYAPAEIHR